MGPDYDPITNLHTYSPSYHHLHHHVGVANGAQVGEDHHSLSRLSLCNNSNSSEILLPADDASSGGEKDEEGGQSDCGDADEVFSDKGTVSVASSDSEKEEQVCLSLPTTPAARRTRLVRVDSASAASAKEYASENEAQRTTRRRRNFITERWLGRSDWEKKKNVLDREDGCKSESECMVITRSKGGSRSLCMESEEVKACKDLGIEMENERTQMMDIPSRLSIPCRSPADVSDTSSGGNSPISRWKISSPGDDPKEVKARLKAWAHAVAWVSTSPQMN